MVTSGDLWLMPQFVNYICTKLWDNIRPPEKTTLLLCLCLPSQVGTIIITLHFGLSLAVEPYICPCTEMNTRAFLWWHPLRCLPICNRRRPLSALLHSVEILEKHRVGQCNWCTFSRRLLLDRHNEGMKVAVSLEAKLVLQLQVTRTTVSGDTDDSV